MTLHTMAMAFIQDKPRRGRHMYIEIDGDETNLRYTRNGNIIASKRKEGEGYVLYLHPSNEPLTYHTNRLRAILYACACRADGSLRQWDDRRYSAWVMSGYTTIFDMKTDALYRLTKPLMFHVAGYQVEGKQRMQIDYAYLEFGHTAEEELAKPEETTVYTKANSNLLNTDTANDIKELVTLTEKL